jgi:hypothetical protein
MSDNFEYMLEIVMKVREDEELPSRKELAGLFVHHHLILHRGNKTINFRPHFRRLGMKGFFTMYNAIRNGSAKMRKSISLVPLRLHPEVDFIDLPLQR